MNNSIILNRTKFNYEMQGCVILLKSLKYKSFWKIFYRIRKINRYRRIIIQRIFYKNRIKMYKYIEVNEK